MSDRKPDYDPFPPLPPLAIEARLSREEYERARACVAKCDGFDNLDDVQVVYTHALKTEIGHLQAKLADRELELAEARADAYDFAKLIVHDLEPCDHACSQCRPHSSMLVDGFVCSYHRAEALAQRGK